MDIDALIAAGWKDAEQRPNDGQSVMYLFEPFMKFYRGNYSKVTDSVASGLGFTTWLPEVLVWYPLPEIHQPERK